MSLIWATIESLLASPIIETCSSAAVEQSWHTYNGPPDPRPTKDAHHYLYYRTNSEMKIWTSENLIFVLTRHCVSAVENFIEDVVLWLKIASGRVVKCQLLSVNAIGSALPANTG